jgi:hypothetical protein
MDLLGAITRTGYVAGMGVSPALGVDVRMVKRSRPDADGVIVVEVCHGEYGAIALYERSATAPEMGLGVCEYSEGDIDHQREALIGPIGVAAQ